MLARTKTKIEIVSDVIAGLGVLVVFGVTLAGGANYSRSKPASAAPANVITSPATATAETNATLNGEIIASDTTVTARGFEWGTSTSYGNSLPDTPTSYYLSQFGSSGSGDGQFNYPFGITLDASGNIYVVDSDNNRVQKFDSSGAYLSQFGSYGMGDGQFSGPYGIALDASGNIYVVDSYNSRVQKFDSSGAYLSQFGSAGSGDGQFNFPEGIALDASGNIYVTDRNDNRVQKFDSSGAYLSQFGSAGSGDGQFSGPNGIVLDASGNIYVADTFNNRVQKFDSSGAYLSQFGSAGSGDGQFNLPEGIALDASGNIYVADSDNNRVQKFDSSGAYLSQFGSAGSGDGQFDYPFGITLDASGNIYVTDSFNHRVQKFSANPYFNIGAYSLPITGLTCGTTYHYRAYATNGDGTAYGADMSFSTSACSMTVATKPASSIAIHSADLNMTVDSTQQILTAGFEYGTTTSYGSTIDSPGAYLSQFGSGGSGDGQFNGPGGITLDASGNIYVVDSNNNRVEKFDSSGAYLSQFGSNGSGDGQFSSPSVIALDASGNIYVTDSGNNRVQKFDSSGAYLSQFGSGGSGDGQFNGPGGITLDASGNIYVTDFGNHRVQKFDSSGAYLSQFGSNGSGDGQFSTPSIIALDASGNIYVTDYNNARVQKFDSSGAYLSQFGSSGSGDGQFAGPTGITLDASGNIYVADYYNNRVQKFDLANSRNYSLPIAGLTCGTTYHYRAFASNAEGTYYGSDMSFTTSACMDIVTKPASSISATSGNLNGDIITSDSTITARGFEWGTDTNYGKSLMSSNTSSSPLFIDYLSQFGSSGSGDGQFVGPTGITLDASGNIYFTDRNDNRVQKFDSSGAYLSQFGSAGSGDGQFSYPYGITLDASGNIYVTDSGNNRVQKFDSSGAYLSQFGSYGTSDGQFVGPNGIALDASGNIYVVDVDNARVQKFDSSGAYLGQFGSYGSGDGQFSYPYGITLDASGNIYVVDNDNARVQKFDSSGAYLSQFGSYGTGDGQFSGPYGIALDASGNIYVVDSYNSRVQKLSQKKYFATGAYSLPIAELSCSTTYHYRALATNLNGTYYGGDQAFRTANCNGTAGGSNLGPAGGSLSVSGGGLVQPAGPSGWLQRLLAWLASLPRLLVIALPYLLILLLLCIGLVYELRAYKHYRTTLRYIELTERYQNLQFGGKNFIALAGFYLAKPAKIISATVGLMVTDKITAQSKAEGIRQAMASIRKQFADLAEGYAASTDTKLAEIDRYALKNSVRSASFSPALWLPVASLGLLLIAIDLVLASANTYGIRPVFIVIQFGLFAICASFVLFSWRGLTKISIIKKHQNKLLQAEQQLMDQKMNAVSLASVEIQKELSEITRLSAGFAHKNQAKDFVQALGLLTGIESSLLLLQKFSVVTPFESVGASDTEAIIKTILDRQKTPIKAKRLAVNQSLSNEMNMGIDHAGLVLLLSTAINNAIKLSDSGGSIDISAQNTIAGTQFVISDTGSGITKSNVAMLMKPFKHALDAKHFDYQGAGLGMYLSRIVIEQIGGQIEIITNPGLGMTVKLDIPRGHIVEPARAPIVKPPSAKPKRVNKSVAPLAKPKTA